MGATTVATGVVTRNLKLDQGSHLLGAGNTGNSQVSLPREGRDSRSRPFLFSSLQRTFCHWCLLHLNRLAALVASYQIFAIANNSVRYKIRQAVFLTCETIRVRYDLRRGVLLSGSTYRSTIYRRTPTIFGLGDFSAKFSCPLFLTRL